MEPLSPSWQSGHSPGRSIACLSQAEVTRFLTTLPSDRWEQAFQALRALKAHGCRVDAINCNAAMKTSATSGPWAVQLALLDMRNQQLQPTTVSFVLSMVALAELGQRWEHGLRFLVLMNVAAIQVNERCLSASIGLHSRCSQWEAAVNLLNPSADDACFNAALLRNEWCRSLSLLLQMGIRGLRRTVITLDTVLRAYREVHLRWREAMYIASRWAIPQQNHAAVYGGLVCTCSAARQLPMASGLFRLMCRSRVSPTSLADPVRAFRDTAAWHLTLQLLDVLNSFNVEADAASCNALLGSCSTSSSWGAAWEIMARLSKAALRKEARCVVAAVDACGKASSWQAALTMTSDSMRADTVMTSQCRNAAISACVPGQWPRSLILASGRNEQIAATVVTLGALLSSLTEGQQWRAASSAISRAMLHRIPANVVVYNTLISSCQNRQDWQHSLQLARALKSAKVQGDEITYNALISGCEKGGRWDAAVSALEEMRLQSVPWGTTSINSAASVQWRQAVTVSQEMCRHRLQADSFTMTALIGAAERDGAWMQSLRMLQQSAANYLRLHSVCINAAVSACQKGGSWTFAVYLLDSKHQPEMITFNACISACSQCVQWQLATNMLCRAGRGGLVPSHITHQAVLEACYLAGQWQRSVLTYSRERVWDVASCSIAVLASHGASFGLSAIFLAQLKLGLLGQLRAGNQHA